MKTKGGAYALMQRTDMKLHEKQQHVKKMCQRVCQDE